MQSASGGALMLAFHAFGLHEAILGLINWQVETTFLTCTALILPAVSVVAKEFYYRLVSCFWHSSISNKMGNNIRAETAERSAARQGT
jgi:ABC-type nitrate/sulfonate/bicarbonate transport system permease component